MKKVLLSITLLMLTGCANPELTKKVTAEFTSKKDVKNLSVCIAEKSDMRTFNGMRIETTEKPARDGGVSLALINGGGYIDIIDKGMYRQVIYRGEAAETPWGKLTNRKSDVISDINSCL
ncbi:hypothetical protein ACJ8LH_09640 [Serratia sp. CY49633]|uniref:hypothetical protein n=1 Tax=Serratia TaxID=613 RepID=UPI0012AC270C|nr:MULTISPECIES: hypothetical protein [Serratia]ELH4208293.1 hypothetical protein [Serratia marcescens]ELL0333257.1 hypothetical protein [Serratia marcescens]MBH2548041.1 hypothetical protein [Serratia marcescens]MBH2551924.1 hypothetical protein [Serratia marcescens]MBH2567176.1 hypothetical protein [Serratia marcescens]